MISSISVAVPWYLQNLLFHFFFELEPLCNFFVWVKVWLFQDFEVYISEHAYALAKTTSTKCMLYPVELCFPINCVRQKILPTHEISVLKPHYSILVSIYFFYKICCSPAITCMKSVCYRFSSVIIMFLLPVLYMEVIHAIFHSYIISLPFIALLQSKLSNYNNFESSFLINSTGIAPRPLALPFLIVLLCP